MRCSTCGETLSGSETQCPTCGARVLALARRSESLPRCPRCGYSGQGVAFFKKPGNVAILSALALVSYGIGGLIYWLMRKSSVICPNCGLRWDWIGPSRQIASGAGGGVYSGDAPGLEEALPRSGAVRRVVGVLGMLLGVLMITVGIAEGAVGELLATGAFFGGTGSLTFWWGQRSLQERRKAILTGMQRQVLRLATRTRGRLTVTEVAAELNLSMDAAENILNELDDGFRVRSEVTEDGVIIYEFPEVIHRRRLESGPI